MIRTTKEMIAVMQAFADGKPIECINYGLGIWKRCDDPSWDWLSSDYRIAPTKPSWNWSQVSKDINFLVRQAPEFGGGVGMTHRPIKHARCWEFKYGDAYDAECVASYDPGTCDWQDSLVVRPGYKEAPQ